MDVKTVAQAVEQLKKEQKKFSQSFDLMIGLKELNLKNPDEQVEFFMVLPHTVGKQRKVCGLVGPELLDEAKANLDLAIEASDFQKIEKKELKKTAATYDYFVGQANIMPKIAQTFGRVLGPRGKMPNPKAGCIVPPKTPLKPLFERLQKTVKISIKKQPNVQVMVGKQDMPTEQLVENIMAVYDQVEHHLPKEKNNIKHVHLKLTMSKPLRLQ